MLDSFCVLQIDRLISYGADVLKPVILVQGERTAVGTAVDYGYFKFYQVWLCSEQDPSEAWLLLARARSHKSSGAGDPVTCVLGSYEQLSFCVLTATLLRMEGELARSLSHSAVWAGGDLKSSVTPGCA